MTQPAAQHRAKSRVKPHVFVADPDVPPDSNGRGACRTCHLIGAAGDSHHTLPNVPEQAAARRRYEATGD
jgi:hypothetical protein